MIKHEGTRHITYNKAGGRGFPLVIINMVAFKQAGFARLFATKIIELNSIL